MPSAIKKYYPFAVISTYSFDDEVCVYLCTSEEEAKNLLKSIYENEVKIDTESGHAFEHELRDDGWYAKIVNYRRCGDVDTSEWRIGHIYGCANDFAKEETE